MRGKLLLDCFGRKAGYFYLQTESEDQNVLQGKVSMNKKKKLLRKTTKAVWQLQAIQILERTFLALLIGSSGRSWNMASKVSKVSQQ